MNLNLIRPKNGTESFLVSITKNCETFSQQTHRKAEAPLEFRLIRSREIFLSNHQHRLKDLGCFD